MNKAFLVVHNHELLNFEHVKQGLVAKSVERLSGILISGEKLKFLSSIKHRKKRAGIDWFEWSSLVPIWTRSEIREPESESLDFDAKDLNRILFHILNDIRTFLIADRNYIKRGNSYITTIDVRRYVKNALRIITKSDASCIIYQTTPHDLVNWVFGRTAELYGLQVYILKVSVLPWRVQVKTGIIEQKDVIRYQGRRKKLSPLASDYIRKNKREYAIAEPEWSKKRKKDGVFNKWSWWNEIKSNVLFKSRGWLSSLVASYEKKKSFDEYLRVKSMVPLEMPFCGVFFLHYQPERTTVPEGGMYGQQLNAIMLLASAMPAGGILIVKEHPSMFRRPYTIPMRPSGFYEAIVSDSNVLLAPVEHDVFELIDNADFVSTITGTVGFQALCRNKPVICFGDAPYKDAPFVFRADVQGAKVSIDNAKDTPQDFTDQLREYVAAVECGSFSVGLSYMQPDKKGGVTEGAHIAAIKWLLSDDGQSITSGPSSTRSH